MTLASVPFLFSFVSPRSGAAGAHFFSKKGDFRKKIPKQLEKHGNPE